MGEHKKNYAQRSQARRYVLQVLYADELNPAAGDVQDEIFQHKPEGEELAFADRLIEAVKSHLSEIDPKISSHLKRWSLSQMNVVDKNILRLGVAEMLYTDEHADKKVIINEAVEMAKKFGGDQSYRLINGILDTIAEENHL